MNKETGRMKESSVHVEQMASLAHINLQFLCSAVLGPSGFIEPATPLVQMISFPIFRPMYPQISFMPMRP